MRMDVTTPKLPPPPRMAQYSSGSCAASVVKAVRRGERSRHRAGAGEARSTRPLIEYGPLRVNRVGDRWKVSPTDRRSLARVEPEPLSSGPQRESITAGPRRPERAWRRAARR